MPRGIYKRRKNGKKYTKPKDIKIPIDLAKLIVEPKTVKLGASILSVLVKAQRTT